MKYLVCLKEVPNTRHIEIDYTSGNLKRDTVGSIPNESDNYALSALCEIKKICPGESYALTMGPKQSRNSLRQALSLGVDFAYQVHGKEFVGADVYATAFTLSQAIRSIANIDIVLLGERSSDGETGQVPSELAYQLNYNFVPNIIKICEVNSTNMVVMQQEDNKISKILVKLPVVLSIKNKSFKKIESTLKAKREADKKEIKYLELDNFIDKEETHYGISGSKTRVVNLFSKMSCRKSIKKQPDLKKDIVQLMMEERTVEPTVEERYDLLNKKILVCGESDNISAIFEILSKIQSFAKNFTADLFTVNFTRLQIEDIKKSKIFSKILSYKANRNDYYAYIEILKDLDLSDYKYIFAPSTDKGKNYLPYIAAKNQSGITADCSNFELEREDLLQVRPTFSEKLYAKIKSINNSKVFSTYRVGKFDGDLDKGTCDTQVQNINYTLNEKNKILETKILPEEKINESEVIFVVGNAIKTIEDLEIIKKAARNYNAEIYCTRPLVIGGLMDSARQVGVSGKTPKAKVAVLIGVAGTNQTMEGLTNVEKIIAINDDNNSELFKKSDIYYKCRWQEIFGG